MTTLEVAIDSIAAGGDGIARSDGMVVFVPRTAPGDRVRVQVDARKRFARGSVESILSPSKQRVQPLCYHYRVDRCGGCHGERKVSARRGKLCGRFGDEIDQVAG